LPNHSRFTRQSAKEPTAAGEQVAKKTTTAKQTIAAPFSFSTDARMEKRQARKQATEQPAVATKEANKSHASAKTTVTFALSKCQPAATLPLEPAAEDSLAGFQIDDSASKEILQDEPQPAVLATPAFSTNSQDMQQQHSQPASHRLTMHAQKIGDARRRLAVKKFC
jgi:hypothetical protein